MAINDITAASSTLIIDIKGLATGYKLDHFSADGVLSADEVQYAEYREGVDGHLSVGIVLNPYPITINLETGSNSVELLRRLVNKQLKNLRTYTVNLTVTYGPEDSKTIVTYLNGALTSGPQLPNIGKVLEATSWKFVFERCEVATQKSETGVN